MPGIRAFGLSSRIWRVPVSKRCKDPILVAKMEEPFHCGLVAASGNSEVSRPQARAVTLLRLQNARKS